MECTLIKQFVDSPFHCALAIKDFWEIDTGFGRLFNLFSKVKQCKC